MVRICVKCWKKSPIEARHCIHCGESLGTVKCESCDGLSPLGAKFCNSCGAELPIETETVPGNRQEKPSLSVSDVKEAVEKDHIGFTTNLQKAFIRLLGSKKPKAFFIFIIRWIAVLPSFLLAGLLTHTIYNISWGQISDVGYDIEKYGKLGGHWIEGPIFIYGISVAVIVVPAFTVVYVAPALKRTVLVIIILFFCLSLANLLITGYSIFDLGHSLWSENALTYYSSVIGTVAGIGMSIYGLSHLKDFDF